MKTRLGRSGAAAASAVNAVDTQNAKANRNRFMIGLPLACCVRRLRRSAAADVIITVELGAFPRKAGVFCLREVMIKLRAKLGLLLGVTRIRRDIERLPRVPAQVVELL